MRLSDERLSEGQLLYWRGIAERGLQFHMEDASELRVLIAEIDALTAENEKLQRLQRAWVGRKYENVREHICELQSEISALTADNERLREALRHWEWREEIHDGGEVHICYCPACGALDRDGHKDDCWMRHVLEADA